MIEITILPNGNLEMSLTTDRMKHAIRRIRRVSSSEITAESIFISEYLGSDNTSNSIEYSQVAPEEVGALTAAPIISDGDNVYGYMSYQVQNFLDELLDGKPVIWQKG